MAKQTQLGQNASELTDRGLLRPGARDSTGRLVGQAQPARTPSGNPLAGLMRPPGSPGTPEWDEMEKQIQEKHAQVMGARILRRYINSSGSTRSPSTTKDRR